MGSESNASTSSSSTSSLPTGKRNRDPEDEVYLDNFHSHKRYLSEIMASSLNGLTVGDHPPPENLIDSPVRDEILAEYSPMSEDSDDTRYNYEMSLMHTSYSLPETAHTSPISPHRNQKSFTGLASSSSQQTRQRGSDTEGRFPSSPSDLCHPGDLRKAALLRSMRSHPLGSSQSELQYIESEDPRPFSCLKPAESVVLYQVADSEKQESSCCTSAHFENS